MMSVPGSAFAALPPDLAARLAESLRAPGAFAVDAETATVIAPPDAAALRPEAQASLAAFAREQRGAAAALLDLPLDGAGQAATPCACRTLTLSSAVRVVIVVPIDGGAHAAPKRHALDEAADAPPIRILWQCDADGRITHVGDQLRRLLGEQAGAVSGRRWSDLIGDVLLDPTGALGRALARRETANGVELLWSSDRDGSVTMHWSGAPAFDGARRFRGFRGFLLAPGRLAAALPRPHTPPVESPQEPSTPALDDAPPPQQTRAETPPAAPPQSQPTDLPSMPHLSTAERNAFREIARALGVRVSADAPPAPAAKPDLRIVETPPAETEPKAADSATSAAPPEALEDAVAPSAGEAPISPSDLPANDDRAEAEPPAPAPSRDETAVASAASEPVDQADATASCETDATPAQPSPAAAAPQPVFDAAAIEARVAALAAALASTETLAAKAEEDRRELEEIVSAASQPPAGEPPSVSEPAPRLAPDPLQLHAPEILDRIPVGVLVSRGDKILFANRTLMELLDFPSLAAMEAHGGVAGLFKGRAPLSERDGPTGPVLLNSRSGESIAVDARLQGVEWDEEPATLVTFRRALDVEVSQRLRATELDLRAREAELRETRAVLDTATDGVALIDEDGRIMTMNRTAEALFGFEQNEVAGETISILFAPESHALAADYFEGLKSGGVRSVLNDGREIIGRVRQGGRIPLFVTFGQISDKPSRKFCAVMRDMTPWKKTERDLIDARKAAEQASAQKSDFLAKISHEIRTPLNAIIGFAEVMMEERFGPVGNERYKDYLRDIHTSGGHVISLVNDLLDLSKIEAGKLDLNFVSVNANEIIRGAVSLMQPQSQRARVVVRSALAGKLPAVVADERALKQIIINLLSNAVKFTDSGGQVIVSTTLTDLGEVAIRIRDTGIGMTEKELADAMEPFRQLATARRAGGTGLGLPLTRALVEANRANLKMSSVKNEGTLAEVVFPPTRVLAE